MALVPARIIRLGPFLCAKVGIFAFAASSEPMVSMAHYSMSIPYLMTLGLDTTAARLQTMRLRYRDFSQFAL